MIDQSTVAFHTWRGAPSGFKTLYFTEVKDGDHQWLMHVKSKAAQKHWPPHIQALVAGQSTRSWKILRRVILNDGSILIAFTVNE